MKSKLLLAGLAAALISILPPQPAFAEEQGSFFANVLGNLGLMPRERDPIDYRERAPLVVPPKMTLPPPQPPAKARGTNWPTDPDVVARRERRAKDAKPVVDGEDGRDIDDQRLSPTELRRHRTAGPPSGPFGPIWGSDRGTDQIYLPPGELQRMRTITSESTELRPGEMPKRRSLTDPPGSLRVATQKVAPKSEPIIDEKEGDPKKFIREEALRR